VDYGRSKKYYNAGDGYDGWSAGMIDAVVSDKAMALSYLDQKAANLKIAGNKFVVENYGIAVCNQNAKLSKRINVGLASVDADGPLNQLVEKWITNAGK